MTAPKRGLQQASRAQGQTRRVKQQQKAKRKRWTHQTIGKGLPEGVVDGESRDNVGIARWSVCAIVGLQ